MATKKVSSQEIIKKPNSSVATIEKHEDQVASSAKSSTHQSPRSSKTSSSTSNITKIIIKYDVGFGNTLYLRGHGFHGLSWDKGVALKNIRSNEWLLEITTSFIQAEFKVLINDKVYETGPNHTIKCGSSIQYSPHF